ncbi:MAG TPA: LuxR C-terminal-related transcriptional regulator, partial [Hyphomicrobiaceae bacterium]|nr:LuxR C-terminal-related transcriptional regulator [Hyphomicrobiaceae bacterium]
GEAFETVHRRDLDPVLSDLAHHFRAAGLVEDAEKTIDYAMRAAQRADTAFAFEDAVVFYENALDTLEGLGGDKGDRRLRLLLLLGMAQHKAIDLGSGIETVLVAAHEARRLGLPTALAEAAIALADTFWRADTRIDARATPLIEEALSVLPPDALSLRSELLGVLALNRSQTGDLEQARALAAQSIDIARKVDAKASLARSLIVLIDSSWSPTKTEEALKWADEIVSVGHLARELEIVARGHMRRAVLLLELGDFESAVKAVDEVGGANARIRQPLFTVVELTLRATMRLVAGDLAAAERCVIKARDLFRKAPNLTEPLSLLIFTLRREQGRLKQFAPLVKAYMTQQAGGAIWKPGLALLYVALDELTEARALLDEIAADDFAALPNDGRLGASLVYLTETCTALRDEARAAVLYRLLRPWRGRNVVMGGGTGFWGSSGRYLGQLAGVLGNWQTAERHFAEALAMNAKVGARLQLAHTHYDFARMLLDRGWPGDSKPAVEHLVTAARIAEELGLVALAEKVAACREGLKPTTASPVGPDNLTGREMEVLRLLAIGRSNGDIALALGISQSTVASHVHKILSKTGCDNRTEAAAYAARNGLGTP